MAQTYVTQSGDTLWDIAQRIYGDGTKWSMIHEANRATIGDDPQVIHAGATLVIPDIAGPPIGGQYVTVANDTLWDIAQRNYGDGTQWTRIYEANKATIGGDPNVLHSGLTLIIP